MLYYQIVLFSASIFIAAIIGGLRFKKIDPAFFAIVVCFWIASVNEVISFILSKTGFTTILNNNIYVLTEAILITFQFKKWGLFSKQQIAFPVIVSLLVIVWGVENYQGFAAKNLHYGFRIMYSFLVVMMSIHLNNSIIYTHHGNLLLNPVFQFCTGFIIFFTCKIMVEAAWLYGLNFSIKFLTGIYEILSWINLFANLIYASATLCIPAKKKHFVLS